MINLKLIKDAGFAGKAAPADAGPAGPSRGKGKGGGVGGGKKGAAADLLTGLVSWYRMEEASGTRVDAVSGNNLLAAGTVTGVTGKNGNGASTDGTNDVLYITNVPAAMVGTPPFSLSCWVKPASVTGQQLFFSGGGSPTQGWGLYGIDDAVRLLLYDGTQIQVTNSSALTIGAWTHIAAVVADGTATVYTNGSAGTPQSYGTLTTATGALTCFATFGYLYDYNGVLDEVVYWSKALNSADIALLGTGVTYTDL